MQSSQKTSRISNYFFSKKKGKKERRPQKSRARVYILSPPAGSGRRPEISPSPPSCLPAGRRLAEWRGQALLTARFSSKQSAILRARLNLAHVFFLSRPSFFRSFTRAMGGMIDTTPKMSIVMRINKNRITKFEIDGLSPQKSECSEGFWEIVVFRLIFD